MNKIKCFFGFHDVCMTSDLELETCVHYCRLCAKPLKVYVVNINMTALGFDTQENEDKYLNESK